MIAYAVAVLGAGVLIGYWIATSLMDYENTMKYLRLANERLMKENHKLRQRILDQ